MGRRGPSTNQNQKHSPPTIVFAHGIDTRGNPGRCSPRGGQKAPGGRDITSPGRNLREREFVCVGALPSDLEIRSSGSIPSATDAQSNGAGSFTSAWLEVTKKKGTNISKKPRRETDGGGGRLHR